MKRLIGLFVAMLIFSLPTWALQHPGGGGAIHANVVGHCRLEHYTKVILSYTFEHLREWTAAAISVAKNEKRCRARLEILPVR